MEGVILTRPGALKRTGAGIYVGYIGRRRKPVLGVTVDGGAAVRVLATFENDEAVERFAIAIATLFGPGAPTLRANGDQKENPHAEAQTAAREDRTDPQDPAALQGEGTQTSE